MSKIDPPFDNSEMKIQWMAVDAVIPYEKNPRKIPKEAIEKVANSIREFGFKQPIVVDKDMVIIVGHTRLMAAKHLGLDMVPVLIASEQMGRCCRMMEYDPIFCQVIINRWEALTGKTAVKIC